MNERERYMFHMAILQIMKEQKEIPELMFREVLGRVVKERCRHLSVSEMEKAIEDVSEELMSSKNVLGFIEDDIKRITGGSE
tara:strand:+ start:22 stop:267 length:246 start_codon:yes stop_codon:yes gene_type:complete